MPRRPHRRICLPAALAAAALCGPAPAWADPPAEPPTLLIDAKAPLRVGRLPAGKAFRVAVRPSPTLRPEQLALWPASSSGCDLRPASARLIPGGPLGEVQGAPAVVFEVDRLPLNSDWCVALDGLAAVAQAERTQLLSALDTLLRRESEPDPPSLPAQRQDLLARALGPLATRTVRCQDAQLCPGAPVDRPLGAVLSAWVEGVGQRSVFVEALNHGEAQRAARADRAAALRKLQDASRTPVDTPEARALAEAVSAPLQTALQAARALGLIDPSTAATDDAGAARPEIVDALARLSEAHAIGQAAWDASACDRRRSGCKGWQAGYVAARRAHAALQAELDAAQGLAAARARFASDFDRWAGGLPLTSAAQTRTQTPAYTDRAAWYISADVGLAVPFFGDEPSLVAYFGASFSLVPIDKDVPLSADGGFWRRFSLLAGVTLNDPEDAAGTVHPALGAVSVLAGAGYRLTDYLRASAGGLIYRQQDPDPSVQARALRVAPFVGLSIDFDVAGLLKSGYDRAQGL